MKYCTRANVHVDRCATAWLIRRFLDPEAEFVFVDSQTPAPGTIPFDMTGVEWGHHENRCSFEQVAFLHEMTDPAIRQIGLIIHGADITADSDATLESAGIDLLFRGLRMICSTDQDTIEQGCVVMDALYAGLSREDRR